VLIEDSDTLYSFCRDLEGAPYIAVDTEFMRDRTYYSQLCLIQICYGDQGAVVDALAPKINLDPLFDLLEDPAVIKVFHAASQDMELFFTEANFLPRPLFDTQIAAMVCGFGDQVGYARLVSELVGGAVDKSFQLTDWSRRPLTKKQVSYALADVTYLCDVYEKLVQELDRSGRKSWVVEDMESLLDEDQYRVDWSRMWRRVKFPNPKPRSAAVMHEIASWREVLAQQKNIPRNWVVKDSSLVEIANTRPTTREALQRVRGIKELLRSREGERLLEAIRKGVNLPRSEWPKFDKKPPFVKGNDNLIALFQALLKLCCEKHRVAPKLVATRAELEKLAAFEDPDIRALKGWRRNIFGDDALAIKEGRLALTGKGNSVELVEIEDV
jgi:ribonuclease D